MQRAAREVARGGDTWSCWMTRTTSEGAAAATVPNFFTICRTGYTVLPSASGRGEISTLEICRNGDGAEARAGAARAPAAV
jgi:hypothetical protein